MLHGKTLSLITEKKSVVLGNHLPFVLIAGPCQMESKAHAKEIAHALTEYCDNLHISLIYKTSFDKANRTSATSSRGIGLEKAKDVFNDIRNSYGCPVLTDVHSPHHCAEIAPYVDVLQIPAFLCRQTDLLEAAAKTGKVINIKKGQFLAPWDMQQIVKKMEFFENKQILLTERGASFGYNTLVSDMRALPIMAQTGYPVIFDATHSVQQPGGKGEVSGGERHYVGLLARAAVAVGVAGVFMETHQDPDNAPSDGPCMIELKTLPSLLAMLKEIDHLIKIPVTS